MEESSPSFYNQGNFFTRTFKEGHEKRDGRGLALRRGRPPETRGAGVEGMWGWRGGVLS